MLDVVCEDPRWDAVADLNTVMNRAATAALQAAGEASNEPKEACALLADDARLRALNAAHRGIDKPTNVLSFPAPAAMTPPGAPLMLGDLAFAFETVQREAAAANKPLADHLTHLVIHGVLHLLGYDHVDDADAQEMEACEIAALSRIGVANPYL